MAGEIKAKIVSVSTKSFDNIYMDSILVVFDIKDRRFYKEFESPILNNVNIKLWRRLCLSVILDKKVDERDITVSSFPMYKKAIMGKEVYVDYDEEVGEIFGLGADKKNLFYPDAYELWMVTKQ